MPARFGFGWLPLFRSIHERTTSVTATGHVHNYARHTIADGQMVEKTRTAAAGSAAGYVTLLNRHDDVENATQMLMSHHDETIYADVVVRSHYDSCLMRERALASEKERVSAWR